MGLEEEKPGGPCGWSRESEGGGQGGDRDRGRCVGPCGSGESLNFTIRMKSKGVPN